MSVRQRAEEDTCLISSLVRRRATLLLSLSPALRSPYLPEEAGPSRPRKDLVDDVRHVGSQAVRPAACPCPRLCRLLAASRHRRHHRHRHHRRCY
eukprot:768394-Hanusia_phi.AAC.2